jgi:hypothetical protein
MRIIIVLFSLCAALTAGAQDKSSKKHAGGYPPVIGGTKSETYRKVGDTELKVWIFEPEQKGAKPLPAIVFFFGGGWSSGSPAQFEPQSRHLAARGMIALVADYRVKTRRNAKPVDCVADAKACVRWVRANAARLGIDPDRIAVGGGSAGGHLAALARPATIPRARDAKTGPLSSNCWSSELLPAPEAHHSCPSAPRSSMSLSAPPPHPGTHLVTRGDTTSSGPQLAHIMLVGCHAHPCPFFPCCIP